MTNDPFRLQAAIPMRPMLLPPGLQKAAAAMLAIVSKPNPLLPAFLFDKPAESIAAHPVFNRPTRGGSAVHVHLDAEATREVLGAAPGAE